MTAKEDGFEEGLGKGHEEGLRYSARNLLLAGFDVAVISNSLNISLERVLQLQSELKANS
ncbi:TPA: hypothetical protein ACGOTT_002172 [Streptococcus suis]